MKSKPITRDSFAKYICALLKLSGASFSESFRAIPTQVIKVRHQSFKGARDAFFSSYGDLNKLWLRVPGCLYYPPGAGHGPGCIGFFVEEAFALTESCVSVCLDGYEVVSTRDLVQGKIS